MAAALGALTLLATSVVGARLQFNFNLGRPAYLVSDDLLPFAWAWRHPELLRLGVPFSVALLAILLAHELGHWLACRHYGMDCTPPIFLPAPTLLGTFGAFIRIRSPFPGRRELFDVGIGGPLAGMAVAVPLLMFGLASSHVLSPAQISAAAQPALELGWPALGRWAEGWLHPGVALSALALSPIARAAWAGLLVTMLNLIPAAQLDGGHILYALAPRVHRPVSWAALVALVLLGWWTWPGWWVFAGLIALMRVRHPWVPCAERLGWGRWLLAAVALAIFVATYCATPIAVSGR